MDLAKIEELIHIVKDARVSELTLRGDGRSITVKKSPAPPPAARREHLAKPEKRQETVAEAGHGSLVVTAPMVGIFHTGSAAAQPGAPVKPGQILGAIESMKLLNDVIAEFGGTIVEVAVEDGLPVEYGQTLFRLDPPEAEKK